MQDDELVRILDALLAGEEPHGDGPVLDRLGQLHSRLQARDREIVLLRSGLEVINEGVARLASLDFDLTLHADTGDVDIDAAQAGLAMLAEELEHGRMALIEARDRAVSASRAKSSFLANMSHELRTPLNAILGYTELVLDELGERGEHALELGHVLRASEHLLELITAVLDLERLEAGRTDFEIEPLGCGTIVEEVVMTTHFGVHTNGNELEVSCRSEQQVLADRTRLRQILINLVSNAAKFTRNGRIRLQVRDDGRMVCFDVQDTGMGISPERLVSVFEAFDRGGLDSTAPQRGTGLGLAIARSFAEGMNGSLTAESEVGQGSVFRLRLPAA